MARARRGHRAVVEAGNGGGRHGGDVERVRGEDCQDPTPPATSDPTPSAAAALREREGAEGEGTAGATRLDQRVVVPLLRWHLPCPSPSSAAFSASRLCPSTSTTTPRRRPGSERDGARSVCAAPAMVSASLTVSEYLGPTAGCQFYHQGACSSFGCTVPVEAAGIRPCRACHVELGERTCIGQTRHVQRPESTDMDGRTIPALKTQVVRRHADVEPRRGFALCARIILTTETGR